MSFKDDWDLESALRVLQHPTVDAKLWADAVEWLLKYGPPTIKKILLDASENATQAEFPDFKPSSYTSDGQPMYNIEKLAGILGISEKEVQEIITKKGMEEEPFELFAGASKTVH